MRSYLAVQGTCPGDLGRSAQGQGRGHRTHAKAHGGRGWCGTEPGQRSEAAIPPGESRMSWSSIAFHMSYHIISYYIILYHVILYLIKFNLFEFKLNYIIGGVGDVEEQIHLALCMRATGAGLLLLCLKGELEFFAGGEQENSAFALASGRSIGFAAGRRCCPTGE